jgi:putative Mg2+ transporter-C (MgtC) family protein
MIQANLLLPLSGKTSESFAVMDLMRLPLGILTGVGFIGGGAILKKGDLVTGVTTAATLWLVTVIGLCFGGGQLTLGGAATGLAVITLWGLKRIDLIIPREHRAKLTVTCPSQWTVLEGLPQLIKTAGYHARFFEQKRHLDSDKIDYSFEISWKRPELDGPPVMLLEIIDRQFPIQSFELTTDNGR